MKISHSILVFFLTLNMCYSMESSYSLPHGVGVLYLERLSGQGCKVAVLEPFCGTKNNIPSTLLDAFCDSQTFPDSNPEREHGVTICNIIGARKSSEQTAHGIAYSCKIKYIQTPISSKFVFINLHYLISHDVKLGYDFTQNRAHCVMSAGSQITRKFFRYYDKEGSEIKGKTNIIDDNFELMIQELQRLANEAGKNLSEFMLARMKEDEDILAVLDLSEDDLKHDLNFLGEQYLDVFASLNNSFDNMLKTSTKHRIIGGSTSPEMDEQYAHILESLIGSDIKVINVSDALPVGPKSLEMLHILNSRGVVVVIAAGNAGFPWNSGGINCSDFYGDSCVYDAKRVELVMPLYQLFETHPQIKNMFLFVGALEDDFTTVVSTSNKPGNMFADRFIFAWGGKHKSTSEATAFESGVILLLQEAFPLITGQQLANVLIANADVEKFLTMKAKQYGLLLVIVLLM